MASDIIVFNDQSTTLSAAQDFPLGAAHIEVWGLDDSTAGNATAHEACWIEITDQGGDIAPIKIAAGEIYRDDWKRGERDSWTYKVRADASTTDIIVKFG